MPNPTSRVQLLSIVFLIFTLAGSGAVTSPLKWNLEKLPEHRADHLVQMGFLSVTHFGADPSGKMDSTKAIQECINLAYSNNLACYFPAGEYLVSAQLRCIQEAKDMTNTHVLIGELKDGRRPVIRLKDKSLTGEPDAMVFMQAQNPDGTENVPSGYNMLFRGIDLDMGTGNSGAIGLYLHGAQGCAVQDTTISGTGHYAGLQHLSGSGACYGNITVIGGQYGIDTTADIGKNPVIAGLKLIGQEKEAIRMDTATPLTVVGFHFNLSGSALASLRMRYNNCTSHLSLIDGIIESASASIPLIDNIDRSVFLKNVYIHNARTVVHNHKGPDLQGEQGAWTRVNEYAYFHGDRSFLVNGDLGGPDLLNNSVETGYQGPIPSDLIQRHVWNEDAIANPGNPTAYVDASSFGADRHGKVDSTTALQAAIDAASKSNKLLFLPKGEYRISKTLQLHANTRFSGISRNFSIIRADEDWQSDPDVPMLATVADTEASTQIAFMKLHPPADYSNGVYYLDWQAGRHSIVREVWFEKNWSRTPYRARTIRITGSGGGRWYGLFTRQGGPASRMTGFRYLTVRNTSQPLHIYAYCPEYAECDYQAEFISSSNIFVYALKAESDLDFEINTPVLHVRDCTNVMICGYTGIGQVDSGDGLIEIEGSDNLLMANMARWGKHFSSPGNTWYYVWDEDAGRGILNAFTDKPAGRDINVASLYKKGTVDLVYAISPPFVFDNP